MRTPKVKEYEKEYYKKHKAEYADRRKKWRENNPSRSKFLCAKADAKRRKLTFELTNEALDALWAKGCSYCSKDLLVEKGISVDRLDNDLGYVESNVVPCCGTCNSIKSDILTFDEMKVGMKAILEYRNAKRKTLC